MKTTKPANLNSNHMNKENNEVKDAMEGIAYWNSSNITMPWGMSTYRWHGQTLQGWPKIVESWIHDNKSWEPVKNVNVFIRISKNHKPNLNKNS